MSPLKDALESLSSTSVSCLAYENCPASKWLEGNLECKFAVLWCSRARSLGQRACTRAGVVMSIPDCFCISSFPWKGTLLGTDRIKSWSFLRKILECAGNQLGSALTSGCLKAGMPPSAVGRLDALWDETIATVTWKCSSDPNFVQSTVLELDTRKG